MTGFNKVMRFCNTLQDYESAKNKGTITDDLFVVILQDKLAKFKGQTFDWSENADLTALATKGELEALAEEIASNEKVWAEALNDLNERINNIGTGGGGGGGTSDIVVDAALSTTSTNAIQNKAVANALNEKQDTISDLATIRSNASKGATAVQSVKTINGQSIEGDGNLSFADEEDLTLENGLLKFKGRENQDNMGYVILRKNKTFAEQMSQSNTIYEIRYEFDLFSSAVNIPQGSVLYFNGGMVKNGNLVGDFTIKANDKKIFSKIVFEGDCTSNQEYIIDWFVDNVSVDYQNLVDCSSEIQDAINSNVDTIRFTNKLFYCPKTINITRAVNILGNMERLALMNDPETIPNIKTGIYTNQHNTIFKFSFSNDRERTLKIAGLLFITNYSDCGGVYTYDNIPVLSFNEGKIVDLDIDCDMFFVQSLDANGYRENHGKGIYIHAGDLSYYNFIRLSGDVNNALVGYDIDQSGGGFVSDVHHYGNLYAVKGIITKSLCTYCHGCYQPRGGYSSKDNGEGFIDTYGDFSLYSMVYDLGIKTSSYVGSTAQWAIARKKENACVTTTIPYMEKRIFPYMPISETEKDLPTSSVFDNFYFKYPEKVFIQVKNVENGAKVDVTEECTITGHNNMFNPFISLMDNVNNELVKVVFPSKYSGENIQVIIKLSELDDKEFFTFGRNYLYFYALKSASKIYNIFKYVDVSLVHDGKVLLQRENILLENSDYNINKMVFPIDKLDSISSSELSITFKGLRTSESFGYIAPFGITNERCGRESLTHGGVIDGDITENSVITEKPVKGINSDARVYNHIRKGANFSYDYSYNAGDVYVGSFTLTSVENHDVFLFGKCHLIVQALSSYSAGDFVAHIHLDGGNFTFGSIRHSLSQDFTLNGIIDKTARLVHLYAKPGGIAGRIQLGFNVTDMVAFDKSIKWVVYEEDISNHVTTAFSLTPCPAYGYTSPQNALNGTQYYHRAYKKQLFKVDNTFVDAFGFPEAIKVGTTAQRPNAATVGAGYWYFDTTLGYVIWSNGADWINSDGTSL